MSIILGKGLKENLWDRNKRAGNFQVNQGWVDSSSRVGQNKGQLTEDQYYASLNAVEPLVKYIIANYTNESDFPLLVIGYNAAAIAIELSQWTYPVVYVSLDREETNKVRRDCEIHAGNFKRIVEKDYKHDANLPSSRVSIFNGIISNYASSDAVKWMKDLLTNSYEVLCALPPNRNWYNLFSRDFDVVGIKHTKDKWQILKINKK